MILLGLFVASVSRDGLLGFHGWIIVLFGFVAVIALVNALANDGPSPAQLER